MPQYMFTVSMSASGTVGNGMCMYYCQCYLGLYKTFALTILSLPIPKNKEERNITQ